MNTTNTPNGPSRGAVASLSEIVAELINGYAPAGQDSTGQEQMVSGKQGHDRTASTRLG